MNYTTDYDEAFMNNFKHLKNHPQLLPFVGAEWNSSPHKLLLVAESHYVPKEHNNKIGPSEWNNVEYLKSLNDERIFNMTNTRKNVEEVVERRGHIMHKGISSSIMNVFKYKSQMDAYRKVSYYNYFQRPAETNGESIKGRITPDDHQLAYDFHKSVVEALKPKWVIFLSELAYYSYKERNSRYVEKNVSRVPPPTTSYWNKKTKVHDNRTGKEKFEEIIGKVF